MVLWSLWTDFKNVGMPYFTFMWPCIVTNFFAIKPTRCTSFTNLFCHETLQVCRQLSSRTILILLESCPKTVYKRIWHILLLSVQWIYSWWWTDELSETCRVSRQNKFGFITRKVGVPLLFSFLLQTYRLTATNVLHLVPWWWVSRQYPQLVENNCHCSHSCLKVFFR
jgi:hypothetical protein